MAAMTKKEKMAAKSQHPDGDKAADETAGKEQEEAAKRSKEEAIHELEEALRKLKEQK